MRPFKVGDCVRLKPSVRPRDRAFAVIHLFYHDIDGGVRLDRRLGGFWSWNITDLEHAEKVKP